MWGINRGEIPADDPIELPLRHEPEDLRALYPYLAKRIPESAAPIVVELRTDGLYLLFRMPTLNPDTPRQTSDG
ncbi:hypothetical protein [Tsukamurella pulmonis]|uniref:hypothetical protein n=1 Tax=Tsukamurella pulmonis TaxID=47312 RepID=UPI000E09DC10|nr:hypothetical protein [Tsukamurella pulmonis]